MTTFANDNREKCQEKTRLIIWQTELILNFAGIKQIQFNSLT